MELASKSQLRWSLVRATAVFVLGLFMLAGIASQLGSGDSGLWFYQLAKPAAMPALGTFTLVWTTLYIVSALAAAIVWQAHGNRLRGAGLTAWFVHAALALAWGPLFFGFKSLAAAMGVGVALVLATAVTALLFFRMRPNAGLLMLLPLLWYGFAAYLGAMIWTMNPGGVPAAPLEPPAQIERPMGDVPLGTAPTGAR